MGLLVQALRYVNHSNTKCDLVVAFFWRLAQLLFLSFVLIGQF